MLSDSVAIIKLTLLCLVLCALFLPLIIIVFLKVKFAKSYRINNKNIITIGIFHPYCSAGGGGERVLWAGIQALQSKYKNVQIYIYTGDLDADRDKILNNVEKLFNIKLEDNVNFIYLFQRKWVETKNYPYFTLLGQSLGSLWLGYEALTLLQPDIFIDTMGYAFTYPLFKYIGGCKIASYTHYPTISKDMLRHVYRRVIVHNNRQVIARNPFLTAAKMMYYKMFAFLYGIVGRTADIIMVNSSWTEDHINSIWKCPLRTHRIYPPCDIEKLVNLPLINDEEKGDIIRIISIGQFRPEKNHPLMLRAMYELRSIVDENTWQKIRLILIGSTRNNDDEIRVKDMKDLSKHLALDKNVEFQLNISYAELLNALQQGTIGLHTMWNEHFGISIVECMAAGLIMVAHASGGPKADIIETQTGSRNGFLANEAEEYAQIIACIIKMTTNEKDIIRNAARSSVNRFSTEHFEKEFIRTLEPLFRSE
ncbi:PREDICTED: GDP-Man:Man(3)GlcNAc(2)-PP-Dol alpha-1,2-mannosyltransferase isoform X1 [Ceratosolen solmsi marchali]|uniref:GDP-Man:Man(3)GlcNAc(2)-PP-Dol alpha-1,2-mannosyltransferase n=2 Tax=Ceratosolen solmsi marchali TaxID=326594 RepID=A0AAJ6VIQ2_9HYME|nr:PREDICTED: GDP-Man:Man(3)GlcNAc(2)-PP-Dol alpha-1,2-mannosyltransferase isoform X1 [Ceratosolen solmsi marchali]